MRNRALFKIIIIVALCVLLLDILAGMAAAFLVVFVKEAIIMSPILNILFIAVFTINSALFVAVILYLLLRKA